MRDLTELNMNERAKPVRRPPPSAEQIGIFRAESGINLPDEYLRLLAFANGGHPELDLFIPEGVPPGGYRYAVSRFYGLNDDRDCGGSLWRARRTFLPILGDDAFVFAFDGGGNQFFLDLSRTPSPVKVWFHDENDLLVEVAASFEAFIDGLRLDPDAI